MKALLTGAYNWNEEQIAIVKSFGFDVDYLQYEQERVLQPELYDVVICNSLFKYNKPELFRSLKMIQLVSAGIDEALREYADKAGIALFNAKGVYAVPIAETIIMQLLNIYKNNKRFLKNQERHIWEKDRGLAELTDKTALIIGYGSIGRETAKRLKAFGVRVTAANRTVKADENTDEVIPLTLIGERAKDYDMVIVSVAACEDTHGLIDKEFFDCMKRGSVFVNVSRGSVIDEKALVEQAESGKLRGIALDVTENEPLDKDSRLWDLEGAYITPHNSFVSDKTHTRMFETILDGLRRFKEGQ